MSADSPLSIPPATFYPVTALSPPLPVPPSWCLTQAEAFARADEHGRPVSFWSRENPVTLRREFSEAAADSFWPWYRGLPPAERHCYELLRTEGSRRACHVYLDCEYYTEHNSGLDGDALTALLVTTLTHGIKAHGLDVESVVELDSSSAAKFSRHLVVRLHDVAFVDNLAAGAFCTALLEPGGRPLDAFVINKPGGTTTFYDTSVYSRNRAFRLYLSSKAGKQVCLLPTARCWQELRGSPPKNDAVRRNCLVPSWPRVLTLRSAEAKCGGAATLAVPRLARVQCGKHHPPRRRGRACSALARPGERQTSSCSCCMYILRLLPCHLRHRLLVGGI
jgi:hypothetical protein